MQNERDSTAKGNERRKSSIRQPSKKSTSEQVNYEAKEV